MSTNSHNNGGDQLGSMSTAPGSKTHRRAIEADKIYATVVRVHALQRQSTIGHTGVQLRLSKSRDALILVQSPEYDANNIGLVFHINFLASKVVFESSIEGNQYQDKVELTLTQPVKPWIASDNRFDVREDKQHHSLVDKFASVVRVWCTMPFETLANGTKLEIIMLRPEQANSGPSLFFENLRNAYRLSTSSRASQVMSNQQQNEGSLISFVSSGARSDEQYRATGSSVSVGSQTAEAGSITTQSNDRNQSTFYRRLQQAALAPSATEAEGPGDWFDYSAANREKGQLMRHYNAPGVQDGRYDGRGGADNGHAVNSAHGGSIGRSHRHRGRGRGGSRGGFRAVYQNRHNRETDILPQHDEMPTNSEVTPVPEDYWARQAENTRWKNPQQNTTAVSNAQNAHARSTEHRTNERDTQGQVAAPRGRGPAGRWFKLINTLPGPEF